MKTTEALMRRWQSQWLAWLVAYWLVLNGCAEKQPSAVFETNTSSATPHTKLIDVSFKQVHINDKFWNPPLETNHKKTLQAVYRKNIESGAIQNLTIAAGKAKGQHRGPFWADSDVYKWLGNQLYRPLALAQPQAISIKAIPYYAWGNWQLEKFVVASMGAVVSIHEGHAGPRRQRKATAAQSPSERGLTAER